MQPGHAAEPPRFAPIVSLDGEAPGRSALFAMEVAGHGEAHVRLACAVGALISAYQAHRGRPVAMMVSLSREELERVELRSLAAALDDAGVPPELLMIRVPRYAAGASDPLLDRVTATGVNVVVANLIVAPGQTAQLAGAPVDMVELPPDLVDEIDRTPEAAGRVDEWMALAHRIDWLVLARNVRRPSQARELSRLGCDLAAGPLMGAPVDPTTLGFGGEAAARSRLAG
ncbi:MAG TPA: EAL domain-containing protein [Kofleriaceae bacterium]|nr:EAL domain-containing protein [Kofleriaceae bacterium]